MTVSDIFITETGTKLTEEQIYSMQGALPCLTCQTKNNGLTYFVDETAIRREGHSRIYDMPCITWTKNGNAGQITYRDMKFICTTDCGVLIPRERFKNELSLKWFVLKYRSAFLESVTALGSHRKLSETAAGSIHVDYPFPPMEEQLAFVEKAEELRHIINTCDELTARIDNVLEKTTVLPENRTYGTIRISDVFRIMTGARITEEEVYEHPGSFPCVTSQTVREGIAWYADKDWLFRIHGNKIIDAPQCLTWARDGNNAGTMFYRDYPFYPNDHCGVLLLRDEFKDKLDIKWFRYTYKNYIRSFASSDSPRPMLYNDTMKEIRVPFPFPSVEFQRGVVSRYDELLGIRKKLEKLKASAEV